MFVKDRAPTPESKERMQERRKGERLNMPVITTFGRRSRKIKVSSRSALAIW